jgi:hypothetical protein
MKNGSAMNPVGNLDLQLFAVRGVHLEVLGAVVALQSLPSPNWKQVSVLQEASVDERNA